MFPICCSDDKYWIDLWRVSGTTEWHLSDCGEALWQGGWKSGHPDDGDSSKACANGLSGDSHRWESVDCDDTYIVLCEQVPVCSNGQYS